MDAAERSAPARVYPGREGGDLWVVEAPHTEGGHETFAGSRALEQALEFAHRAYGSVQVLSR